jgi:gustatory receptor
MKKTIHLSTNIFPNMFRLLKLIFSIGKLFAITPSITGPDLKIATTKIHSVLVLSGLTIAVPFALAYKQSYYHDLIHIKLAVTVLMDVSLYLFNLITIAGVPFWKRQQWESLLGNLQKIKSGVLAGGTSLTSYYIGYFVANLVFCVATVSDFYIWYQIVGYEYFQQYLVETVQVYMLFYYYFVLFAFIKMLRGYYTNLRLLLEEKFANCHHIGTTFTGKNLNFLPNIEHLLAHLRDTVDLFNDLFGWPILLMIVYTSLMVINYIDDTFKNSDNLDDEDFFKVVISNINLVLLFIVNNFSQASISFNADFVDQHFRTDLDVRLRPSRIRKNCQIG